ncbi:MAG: hypothetical protein AB7P76_13030 [Candidatus Melainabacteria bacterium]
MAMRSREPKLSLETPTLDAIADQLPDGMEAVTVNRRTRRKDQPPTDVPVTLDGMALHILCQQSGRSPAQLEGAGFSPQRLSGLRTTLMSLETHASFPLPEQNPTRQQSEKWLHLYNNARRKRRFPEIKS